MCRGGLVGGECHAGEPEATLDLYFEGEVVFFVNFGGEIHDAAMYALMSIIDVCAKLLFDLTLLRWACPSFHMWLWRAHVFHHCCVETGLSCVAEASMGGGCYRHVPCVLDPIRLFQNGRPHWSCNCDRVD